LAGVAAAVLLEADPQQSNSARSPLGVVSGIGRIELKDRHGTPALQV
jgi:hypothetical protein